MNPKDPESSPVCWDCGAANDEGASECWLCQRRDWRRAPRVPVTMKPEPAPAPGDGSVPIGLALALVLLGGAVIAPWFVCGLAIFVLPAWAVAEYIAHRRRKRGLPTSTARRLVWIAVLAIIIPIVMGVSLITAVAVICQFSGSQNFH
jgi:hypothetical protein